MSEVPSVAIETKCTGRSFLRWRRVLFGIVCLFVAVAAAVSVFNCPIEIRRAWLMGWEYDKATYARISKAIAADPRLFSDKRLYDFLRELDLEDIPWDDANVQNEAGSFRIYHFRGFALYVNLYVPSEHWRDVAPQKILLEQGSPEEKRLARDWLRIESRPYASIDGINSREERMRKFWAGVNESIRQFNEKRGLRQ